MKILNHLSLTVFIGLASLGNSLYAKDFDNSPTFRVNETTWKSQWKEISGLMKEKWDKLTNEDLNDIEVKQENLVGKIQHHYGLGQEEAKNEVDDFYVSLSKKMKADPKDVNLFLTLNPTIWKGHWHSIKASMKKKWGKMTNDQLAVIEANQEKLLAEVLKQEGIDQERGKKEVDEFYQTFRTSQK